MLNYFKALIRTHLGNEEGQGMVEYALIIVVIAIAVIATAALVGDQLIIVFNRIVTELGL